MDKGDKIQRQLELELEAVDTGIAAYRERIEQGNLLNLPPGHALMKQALEPLTAAIDAFKLPITGGSQPVRKFLNRLQVSSQELAYLTLRKCLEAVSVTRKAGPLPLQTAAIALAGMVMDQHEYARFKAKFPDILKGLEKNLKTAPRSIVRKAVMLKKRKLGLDDDVIEQKERLKVGCKLIELCITSTGLLTKESEREGCCYLKGTPEAHQWIETVNERCEILSPQYLPMVVPPKAWRGIHGGGYYGNAISRRHTVIKTRNREAITSLAGHLMPQVYEALNSIQETPWRINRKVYEAALALWEEGGGVAGLPKQALEEFPPTPWTSPEEYQRMNGVEPEQVRAWKVKAAKAREAFRGNRSKRSASAAKLRTAEKFLEEPEIYFPHVLDFAAGFTLSPITLTLRVTTLLKGFLSSRKGSP